jgi:hypothetical protein
MSNAARSVYLFSIYLMIMGTVLTIAPNFLLGLFRLPATDEPWIHIVGILAFVLGFYYYKSARNEIKQFFQWTVYGRLAGFLMFCILGFGGFGPPVLILFGVVDGLSALWTHMALKGMGGFKSSVAKGSR